MPKKVERKLMAQARKKGFGKKRANAYTYGTMNKLGLMGKKKAPDMETDDMSKEIHGRKQRHMSKVMMMKKGM